MQKANPDGKLDSYFFTTFEEAMLELNSIVFEGITDKGIILSRTYRRGEFATWVLPFEEIKPILKADYKKVLHLE